MQEFPPELTIFMDGLIFGQRRLSSVESSDRKILVGTISSSIMHNIKTDRQVKYISKRKTQSKRTYIPHQLAALALSIRHCERNNNVLRLLSAPNFGLCIHPRTALLFETMIANAMIKSVEKEGVYISPTMEKGVRISFHIDNFDEQVQTFDGKDTVHYLLIVGFQRNTSLTKPIELELEKTTSLRLVENSFGDIIPCDPPTNRQFKRTKGCMNVTCGTGYIKNRSSNLFVWQCLKALEHIFANDERASYITMTSYNDLELSNNDDPSNYQQKYWTLDTLKIPSFSATSSIVVSMDTTMTNIFALPFVPGPASSISAVFTALDIAHKTNLATIPEKEKEVENGIRPTTPITTATTTNNVSVTTREITTEHVSEEE